MRAVIQRVSSARVDVDGETVGSILCDGSGHSSDEPAQGLLVLAGVARTDDADAARALAGKIWGLRILDGERSAADLHAPILLISQFTLYGDARKGRRPSWNRAAPGADAEPLVDAIAVELRRLGAHVETGRFGAHMQVTSTNDGPVTVLVEL